MFREYSNRISAIARLIVKLLKRCFLSRGQTSANVKTRQRRCVLLSHQLATDRRPVLSRPFEVDVALPRDRQGFDVGPGRNLDDVRVPSAVVRD